MALSPVEVAAAFREALAGFDPALVSGEDCARVAESMAETEKLCAGIRARAAARVAECGAHRARGFTDAAEWLSRTTGSSITEAKVAISTARALEFCPITKNAVASGELSIAQAAQIAATELTAPGSEAELVAMAGRVGLRTLTDTARNARLRAQDVEDLHRRQHAARYFRGWTDGAGMVCFTGALPPETGVRFLNRLNAETDRLRRLAKRDGKCEPREAHAADAFVRLVSGTAKTTATRPDLVLVCDLGAYRRGHVHENEPCHIIGGGPVPVKVAREVGSDAFIKVVLHDGVKIETVAHLGRRIKAELRTALELGAPPEFSGTRCVEEGCGRRYGLEWDHVDPVANGGRSSYENLKARCWPHHRDKTERDRLAGLLRKPTDERSPP